VDDVQVAAPIGFVGSIQDVALSPSLTLMDDPAAGVSDIPAGGETLRLTSTLVQHTEQGDRAVSEAAGVVQLAHRSEIEATSTPSGGIGYPNGFVPQFGSLYYSVPLGQLPSFAAPVLAVDPTAERKLDGGKSSAWLDALQSLPSGRTEAQASDWASRVDEGKYLVQQTALQEAASSSTPKKIVPMVVNTASSSKLTLKVKIEKLAGRVAGKTPSPAELRQLLSDGSFTPDQALTRDVSALTTPFSTPDLNVMLPGSKLPDGEDSGSFYTTPPDITPALPGRPHYRQTGTASAHEYTVTPEGVVAADGSSATDDKSETTGQREGVGDVQSYRKARSVRSASAGSELLAPIGEFKSSDLQAKDSASASYVPSGILDSTGTQRRQDGSQVTPNLSGLDFITSPPGAFTDLAGARTLRGEAPIDAIRVRVANVGEYSDAAQQKVAAVASRIARLGLSARVVAGSSLQQVGVYVPDYDVARSPAHPKDLGWVEQSWTTLGASVAVGGAVERLQSGLLWLVGGALVVGVMSTSLVTGRRRRAEVAVLNDIGWRRARIRRRLTLQFLPSLVLVTVVAGVSTWISQTGAQSGAFSFLVVVTMIIGLAVSVRTSLASPKGRSIVRGGSRVLTSATGLLGRQLLSAPGAAAAQIVGIGSTGLVVGLASAAMVSARSSAGQTRLANVVFSAVGVSTALLAVAGVLAAVVLALLGRKAALERRRRDERLMRSLGFREALLRSLAIREQAVLLAVGAAIAALAGTAVAIWTDAPWWIAPVAGAASCLLLLPVATRPARNGHE